jgi:hypothetical protein
MLTPPTAFGFCTSPQSCTLFVQQVLSILFDGLSGLVIAFPSTKVGRRFVTQGTVTTPAIQHTNIVGNPFKITNISCYKKTADLMIITCASIHCGIVATTCHFQEGRDTSMAFQVHWATFNFLCYKEALLVLYEVGQWVDHDYSRSNHLQLLFINALHDGFLHHLKFVLLTLHKPNLDNRTTI